MNVGSRWAEFATLNKQRRRKLTFEGCSDGVSAAKTMPLKKIRSKTSVSIFLFKKCFSK